VTAKLCFWAPGEDASFAHSGGWRLQINERTGATFNAGVFCKMEPILRVLARQPSFDQRLIQDYLGHRASKYTVHNTRVAARRFDGLWEQ
jgi:hypothetical protein